MAPGRRSAIPSRRLPSGKVWGSAVRRRYRSVRSSRTSVTWRRCPGSQAAQGQPGDRTRPGAAVPLCRQPELLDRFRRAQHHSDHACQTIAPRDGDVIAGVCNYGFGGTNAHVILRGAPKPQVVGAKPATAERRAPGRRRSCWYRLPRPKRWAGEASRSPRH